MNIKEQIREELYRLSEEKYRLFSSSLLPNVDNILGVRIPILRNISKKILKTNNPEQYLAIDPEFMEETIIQGFLIGGLNLEIKQKLNLIKNFIPKITNWAICDTFCNSLKFVFDNKQEVWKFISKYSKSKKEYELRFAYVMMLVYFIEEEFLDEIFDKVDKFNSDKYYAKMAVAWLLSMCYVKYPQKTEKFFSVTNLDKDTFNKSIQKILDSQKISKKDKVYIKTLKR